MPALPFQEQPPLPTERSTAMQSPLPMTERPCPLGFVVLPAFVGGLIWVFVLLSHFAKP
jgi:hypothetical protein